MNSLIVATLMYQMSIVVPSHDYPILIKDYADLIECRRERRRYIQLFSMAKAEKPIIICTPLQTQ